MCDVIVNVDRPDGTVSSTTVTTDADGNFSFAYDPGTLAGEYPVHLLGQDDNELMGVFFTNEPVVTLDKGDYRSDETVHVTGLAYTPLSDIIVQIIRPDGSIVTSDGTPGSDTVTTDAFGNFGYDYVLRDGVMADYLVHVLDADGNTLANTSFTDSGAFVQNLGTISDGTATASLAITVTGTVTTGNSIIIDGSDTNVGGFSSCADSKGNTYTVDVRQLNGAGGSATICSTHNIAPSNVLVSGVDTITVTWTGGGSGHAFSANEFSGLTAIPLDQIKGGTTNNTTPTSTSTATTAQADELLFGAIWYSGTNFATFTAAATGACTGLPTGTYTLTNPAIETGNKLATEYQIATATGTYAACGTISAANQTASMIAMYKIAAVTSDTLTVTKVVDNTGGGTKVVADFRLKVDATTVTSGVQITTTTGAHTVSETTDPNYTAVISGDCAPNGSITLAANDVKACTITNTFSARQATLTVNKTLVPSSDLGLFNLQIDGSTAGTDANVGDNGTTEPQTVTAGVSHTVGEIASSGTNLGDYATTIDCGSGTVSGTSTTVNPVAGSQMTCTITNKLGSVGPVGAPIPTLESALLAVLGFVLAAAGAWTARRRERMAPARRKG